MKYLNLNISFQLKNATVLDKCILKKEQKSPKDNNIPFDLNKQNDEKLR